MIALFPLTEILNKTGHGCKIDKSSVVNHLLYIDDIKLYGKSKREIAFLINTVQGISAGRQPNEIRALNCGCVSIKKGRLAEWFNITSPLRQHNAND